MTTLKRIRQRDALVLLAAAALALTLLAAAFMLLAQPVDASSPPAPPGGLSASAGDGSVTLSWSDPSDSSITGYQYQVNHNDTSTGNLSG